MELTLEQINALRSVMGRAQGISCKRQFENNYEPAACRYPVDGLPRKDWCDTCIVRDLLDPEGAN